MALRYPAIEQTEPPARPDSPVPSPVLGNRHRTIGAVNRQYMTGDHQRPGIFLPDDVYGQALDALVVVCVDCVPVHQGKMLISRRACQPHPYWWINGGRMKKGELYHDAAVRIMLGETRLNLQPERFTLVGYYNLIWDQRAQAPADHGCHTLSVTHWVSLTADEVRVLTLNEEYNACAWVFPEQVIEAPTLYHPALVQMARDLAQQLKARTER